MKDYREVLQEIEKLNRMIPSGFMSGIKWDFEIIWDQIKATQKAFNGSRFPTREERQKSWEAFHNLIAKVKKQQVENREQSAKLRDKIVQRAKMIPSDDELSAFIDRITDDIAKLLRLSNSDSRKGRLLIANKDLNELWELFGNEKSKLFRQDRDTVYQALKNAKFRLDREWAEWKKVQSAELCSKIVAMAKSAWPPPLISFETAALATLTGGASLLAEFFQKKKSDLQIYNGKLNEAWKFYHRVKGKLLPQDQDTAERALLEARNRLNGTWDEYKRVREKTYRARGLKSREKIEENIDKNQRKRSEQTARLENLRQTLRNNEERHSKQTARLENLRQTLRNNEERHSKQTARLENLRQTLRNNEERHSKQTARLENLRQTLRNNEERHSDAWNPSFQERVAGWIAQNEDDILRTEEFLEKIAGWIAQNEDDIQGTAEFLETIGDWIAQNKDDIQGTAEFLETIGDWIAQNKDDIQRKAEFLGTIDGWIRDDLKKLKD